MNDTCIKVTKNGKNRVIYLNSKKGKRKMNTGGMKNIVILKDLPSNLVEEAIVFLKENQKLKKPELIDVDIKKQNRNTTSKTEKNTKDYIISEAQMLISDYISKVENSHKSEELPYKRLKKKYRLLKKISCALAVGLVANIILLFTI